MVNFLFFNRILLGWKKAGLLGTKEERETKRNYLFRTIKSHFVVDLAEADFVHPDVAPNKTWVSSNFKNEDSNIGDEEEDEDQHDEYEQNEIVVID